MTREERKSIHDYLASYRFYCAKRDFGESVSSLCPELRAQSFAIYRSITDMPPSKEKLLLYYYYIQGYTLEVCAEYIGISRRSVFRLKISALELYAERADKDFALKYLS